MRERFGGIPRMLRQRSGSREDGDVAENGAACSGEMGKTEARDAVVSVAVAPTLDAVGGSVRAPLHHSEWKIGTGECADLICRDRTDARSHKRIDQTCEVGLGRCARGILADRVSSRRAVPHHREGHDSDESCSEMPAWVVG